MMTRWYRALRSKEWRRAMYKALRKCGLSREWAQRVRDWSEPHIYQFADTRLEGGRETLRAEFEKEFMKEVGL